MCPEAMPLARGLGMAQIPKTPKAVESPGTQPLRLFLSALGRNQFLLRGRCCLRFVFLKGRGNDDCLLRIGAVNRLAVMPKRSLGKPFRHPDNLCPLCPCVAVAMQGYAGHARLVA